MALHTLRNITLATAEPDLLDSFYQEINFTGGNRRWGTEGRDQQICIEEGDYRTLRSALINCDDEEDLDTAANNLAGLGVSSEKRDGRLIVVDPVNEWSYILEPSERQDVALHDKRVINVPGDRPRFDRRADIIVEEKPRAPRRLGHFVVGSPEPHKTIQLAKALGFRVSDSGFDENIAFLRCSHDHHNFLVTPGPVPYLNHYAIEHDDFDSAFRAATVFLEKNGEDRNLSGPGRHPLGGNIFWYMMDPVGNIFEYFADIDQITDDEAWVPHTDIESWPPEKTWSMWNDMHQPEVFFEPNDMPTIIAGWNKTHG